MFPAILSKLQEALQKQLVYWSDNSSPGSSQQTQHARNIPIVVCAAPPKDYEVLLETCRSC
jgi:hypothetical protein